VLNRINKSLKEAMSMIGLVICTLLICATVIICILGWKYLDERDDLSYQRWNALNTKISNIEELLEKKNGGRG